MLFTKNNLDKNYDNVIIRCIDIKQDFETKSQYPVRSL